MIEAEAKTKWCPFSRLDIVKDKKSVSSGINRIVSDHDLVVPVQANCIGSECMAWAYKVECFKHPRGGQMVNRQSDTEGYCTLMG